MRDSVNRRSRYCTGIALVVFFGLSSSARAATKTWTGGGVDFFWSTATNWSPAGAPAPGDDLVFPAGALRLNNSNDTAPGTAYNSLNFTGSAAGYFLVGNALQLTAGIVAVNGGVNTVNFAVGLSASQTFSVTGARVDFFGTVDLGANTLTLTAPSPGLVNFLGGISGSGGVTMGGILTAGTTATCTYTGPTNITGGYFAVAGPGSLSPASVVTVGSGAGFSILNGGSVGSVTFSPGSYLQQLAFSNPVGNVANLTMQPGSIAYFEASSASVYGQLNVSGSVTLSGSFLAVLLGYTPTPGDAFKLINKTSGGAVAGTFSGLPEGGVVTSGGRLLRGTYVGGDGNDVVVTDAGSVPPEPSAVPAVGTVGLAILGALLAVSAMFALRRSA